MKKILKSYENVRSEENLGKIGNELEEIKEIMDKNFELLMNRGQTMQELKDEAEILRQGTQKYKEDAKKTRI